MFDTEFHAEMRKRMKINYYENGGREKRMIRYYQLKYQNELPEQNEMSPQDYLKHLKKYNTVCKDGKKKKEDGKDPTKAITTSKSSHQHGSDTQTEKKKSSPVEISNK